MVNSVSRLTKNQVDRQVIGGETGEEEGWGEVSGGGQRDRQGAIMKINANRANGSHGVTGAGGTVYCTDGKCFRRATASCQ